MKIHYAAVVVMGLCVSGCQATKEANVKPSETQVTSAQPAATAYAEPAARTAAQCAMQIAGPPPKPAKGADFGSATAKNLGKNVSRNILSGIGSRVAGPLGGVVLGAVAMDKIRTEQDLKGEWSATDGSPSCGCTLDISSGFNLQGKTVYNGKLASRNCTNPLLASVAKWNLGHTFTGYDATFDLVDRSGGKVAALKRDGMDYFSGTLADGTPVTIWRQ